MKNCSILQVNYLMNNNSFFKKRYIILLGLLLIQPFSWLKAQEISINKKERKLLELIRDVESQSNKSFVFNTGQIDVNQKKSLKFNDLPLEEALSRLFYKTGIVYIVKQRHIVLKPDEKTVVQKKLKISGKITDASNGEPIVGVTVSIKGTSEGTITDINGNYSIAAHTNSILVYSFIGYESTEKYVDGNTVINVELQESSVALKEVVAIGYGSTKRKDLTSSISTVQSKDMNNGVYVNPMMTLQGKVPGLSFTKDGNPNGGYSMTLRGPSTLRSGAQSPLFVIDGVVGGIMPAQDDIVSIDILRDASATSIYGSRAANGVVIITTKKGEPDKPTINYNTYVAFETVSNKIDMLSADEYRGYLAEHNLSLSPEDDNGASTNWFDEVSRTAFTHNHNLTLGGGNNNTTYIANVDYKNVEGILKGSARKELKFRANLEQKALNDKLKLACTVSSVTSNREYVPSQVLMSMWNYQPTVGIFNEDGSYYENYSRGNYNPVALIEQNINDRTSKAYFGSLGAQLNIVGGLDYEIKASYKNGQSNSGSYKSKDSRLAMGRNGYAYRSSYESETTTLESFLTYKKAFKAHKIGMLLGYSWSEEKSGNGFGVNASDFASDETQYYNLHLSNNSEGIVYDNSAMKTLRMISFFSRFNYSLNNKYLLQASIRRDGSSAFGVNSRSKKTSHF